MTWPFCKRRKFVLSANFTTWWSTHDPQGLCEYVIKNVSDARERGIVVGHDHRYHSKEWAELTAMVFLNNGFRVYLHRDLVHTPLCDPQPLKINHSYLLINTYPEYLSASQGWKLHVEWWSLVWLKESRLVDHWRHASKSQSKGEVTLTFRELDSNNYIVWQRLQGTEISSLRHSLWAERSKRCIGKTPFRFSHHLDAHSILI